MALESNTEFLTRIMNFSNNGAMNQMFIMDAIVKQAKLVAEANIEDWPADHFISGPAWQEAARGILAELKTKGYL